MAPSWTPDERQRALLAPYVTDLAGDTYCLRGLPPEVSAVLFAYVSRSPRSFRENLLRLLEGGELEGLDPAAAAAAFVASGEGGADALGEARRRARRFHAKWVVGYGHASVAEHADLRFALESVSIVVSKVVEDNRLAGFTEKSTRYQLFDEDAYVRPPELRGAALRTLDEACRHLLRCYVELQEPVRRWVAARYPRDPDVREASWARSVDARVCDIVRYVLPAATRTAIGVSLNARAAAHAVTKLLSHPLAECRALGEAMLREGRQICPTLLEYAAANDYLRETPRALRARGAALLAETAGPREVAHDEGTVRLLHHDPDGEERVIAALLYGATGADMATVLRRVRALGAEERDHVLREALRRRGPHDWPPRALEATSYTMEITCDYGAFRDIQRHRMATQLHPLLDVSLGYETPPELAEAGLAAGYHEAMAMAARAHAALADERPEAAQYVVPLAYRRRTLFVWNLREIEHFVRLRSGRQGHRSYRRVAWEVADAVAAVHPRLAAMLTVDRETYPLERLAAEEKAERKKARAEKEARKRRKGT